MLHRPLFALSAFVALLLCASNAQAQAARTWVSGVGDDVNPCSRTAPCKTFAGAIGKTTAGGEIDALDPGGFGAVTITKSITLDGGAGLGSILSSATNGVNINAGGNDVVILRNLSINGAGATLGLSGVNIIAAGAVHIEDTVISNFSTAGISMPGGGTGTPTALYVKNTSVRSAAAGLKMGPGDPSAALPNSLTASIWSSFFANTPLGIQANGGSGTGTSIALSLYGTVLSGHSTAALHTLGAGPTVTVERGTIAGSAIGVNADTGTVQLSGVMLSQNVIGLAHASGTIISYGNNALAAGNAANGDTTNLVQLQ